MWTIVCLLFSLLLIFVLWYVGSGKLHKWCLPTFFIFIESQLIIVFSTYFIFCSYLYSNQITSIQSGTFNKLTSLTHLYVSNSFYFPCCNLQNMNMLSQWSLLYSTILCEMWLWKESLRHDLRTIISISTKQTEKSGTYNVGNPDIII